jgi:hypothetical protein
LVIAVVAMADGAATLYHALSGTPRNLSWPQQNTPMEAKASIGVTVGKDSPRELCVT